MFSRNDKERLAALEARVEQLELAGGSLLEAFGSFAPALKIIGELSEKSKSEELRLNAELVAISQAFNLVFSHFRELYEKTGHETSLILPERIVH